jgi:hypothetical protein
MEGAGAGVPYGDTETDGVDVSEGVAVNEVVVLPLRVDVTVAHGDPGH